MILKKGLKYKISLKKVQILLLKIKKSIKRLEVANSA